jgi:Zn finger protein HypA/HybF involved in hydrogenase expression
MAKSELSSKCKRCSLDCVVSRGRTLSSIPLDKRKEVESRMYTNANPFYNHSNCPKGKPKNTKVKQEERLNVKNEETAKV